LLGSGLAFRARSCGLGYRGGSLTRWSNRKGVDGAARQGATLDQRLKFGPHDTRMLALVERNTLLDR